MLTNWTNLQSHCTYIWSFTLHNLLIAISIQEKAFQGFSPIVEQALTMPRTQGKDTEYVEPNVSLRGDCALRVSRNLPRRMASDTARAMISQLCSKSDIANPESPASMNDEMDLQPARRQNSLPSATVQNTRAAPITSLDENSPVPMIPVNGNINEDVSVNTREFLKRVGKCVSQNTRMLTAQPNMDSN